MNKKIEFKADQRKVLEESKIDIEKLKKGSSKIEEHHIIGKGNSEETIPLCNECHKFLTIRLNSLSPTARKNLLIKARVSARAMIELGLRWLRILDEEMIENEK